MEVDEINARNGMAQVLRIVTDTMRSVDCENHKEWLERLQNHISDIAQEKVYNVAALNKLTPARDYAIFLLRTSFPFRLNHFLYSWIFASFQFFGEIIKAAGKPAARWDYKIELLFL